MENSNKTLKIVFLILLFITVGELFYFFVYQPLTKNKLAKNEPVKPIPTSINQKTLCLPLYARTGKQAIDNNTLVALSYNNKETLAASILENKYFGEITALNIKDELMLTLTSKTGVNSNFFYKDLSIISVFDNKDVKLTLNDIQTGDKVTLIETTNLLLETGVNRNFNNNVVKLKIIID